MSRQRIAVTPQPRMLRNGDNDAASRDERAVQRPQYRTVVIDVLEYVECPDAVEFLDERQLACVCLQPLRARYPRCSHRQSTPQEFGTGQGHGGEGVTNGSEHESGPAADFQHRSHFREMVAQCIDYQTVAGAEPKVSSFHRREFAMEFRPV